VEFRLEGLPRGSSTRHTLDPMRQIVPFRGVQERILGRPKTRAAWAVCWSCAFLSFVGYWLVAPGLRPLGPSAGVLSLLSGALAALFRIFERPREIVVQRDLFLLGLPILHVGQSSRAEDRSATRQEPDQ